MTGEEPKPVAETTEPETATADEQPARPEIRELILSPEHLAQMEQHAAEAYPEECCGVLIGKPGHCVRIALVRAATNRAEDGRRDRYEIDPVEILHLAQLGEEHLCEIVGFYHSHPDHDPMPSATDMARAWPAYVYVIVGVTAHERANAKAWVYDDEAKRFNEQAMALDPDPFGLAGGLQIVRETDIPR
jgi:proteasome lid subunit RPN8/RPN11